MITRKKRTKAKRTNKKLKQTKTDKPSMTDQLNEARKRYTVSKSSKGSTSAHNGDDVATLLAGNSPEIVCSTAEKLAGLKSGVSPYFEIIKPTIERGFDYRQLNWSN